MDLLSCSPSLYRIWKVPKFKDGKLSGWRTIEAPCDELKAAQWSALKNLEASWSFPHWVYGVKGTSAKQNAERHLGNNILIKLDIKDFFPSTTIEMITAIVHDWSSSIRRDTVLSLLPYCFIYIDGKLRLPQGAPTSPFLASMAMALKDEEIYHTAQMYNLTYTRYVDDLTFSGSWRPPYFVRKIAKILKPEYQVSWKKVESLHRTYQRQEVTGIVVNGKVSIPRPIRYNLRARLDHLARDAKEIDEETKGLLSYIASVSKEQHDTLFRNYERRWKFYREKTGPSDSSSESSLHANSSNDS